MIDLLAPNLILIQICTYLQEACKHTLGVIYFAAGPDSFQRSDLSVESQTKTGKVKKVHFASPGTWFRPLAAL